MADDQLRSNATNTDSVQVLQSNTDNEAHHKDQVLVKVTAATPDTGVKRKEWRTSSLHWGVLISLALIEAGLIAAIIYLERKSSSQNGIVSISQVSTSLTFSYFSISNIWRYGLLWTTLPSLLMTLYRITWDIIVSGASDRQPFVALERRKKKYPGDSTLNFEFDYKSYPLSFAWIVALRNGDIQLGVPMLLSLILSIAIVPLAAHLFVAAQSQSGSVVALNFTTSFNESALTVGTSLQPALDLASANRIYDATPPSWMTSEYAFEKFDMGDGSTITGNLTTETNAYSAQLDCQIFPESSATYTDSGILGGGTVDYNINDRGCEVSGFITVSNMTPTYIQSWQTNCAGSEYGRVGVVAGTYSNESSFKLANYSLVSCVVWYWNTSGSLTVSLQPTISPQFISFTPNASTSIHPWQLYQELEDTFYTYGFFDASNSIQADSFGFSVYSYAQTQNTTSPITPDLIKNCTEDLFRTLYAGLATKILFQDATISRTSTGGLSTPVTRLYIVTPVAYTIVSVLVLALIFNVVLLVYTYRTDSILVEEPFVLVGKEELLKQSHDPQRLVGDWDRMRPKVPFMRKVLCHDATATTNRGEKG